MIRRSDITTLDNLGTLHPGVYVKVLNSLGAVATIYADNGSMLSNPFTSDAVTARFTYNIADADAGTFTEEFYNSLSESARKVQAVDLSPTSAALSVAIFAARDAAAASATASGASAAASASSASSAANYAAAAQALVNGYLFDTAAEGVSQGVISLTITAAGSGGANGQFALAFSGGAGTLAAGTFTVSGGVVTAVNLTKRGKNYTSNPTASTAASAGLTGATITAAKGNYAVPDGEYYLVKSAGNTYASLYKNVAGVATAQGLDIPSVAALSNVSTVAMKAAETTGDPLRNLFIPANRSPSFALVRATGALAGSGVWFTTDFIACAGGSTLVTNLANDTDGTYGGYAWYDLARGFISSGGAVAAGGTIVAPANAAYVRITYLTSVATNRLYIGIGAVVPTLFRTAAFLDTLGVHGRIGAEQDTGFGRLNLFNPLGYKDNFYLVGTTDAETANAAYFISNYMPVVQGGQIVFNKPGIVSAGAPYGIAFYDQDFAHIVGAAGNGTVPIAGTPITVPTGAAYARCAFEKSTVAAIDVVAVRGPTIPTNYVPFGSEGAMAHLKPWWGTVGMHMGDSLTQGFPEWRAYVAKQIGATSTNMAVSGRVMSDCVKNLAGGALVAGDFTGVDWALVLCGTNNWGTGGLLGVIGDAPSATFGNIHANTKYVIETLLALKPSLRLLFATTTYRTAAASPAPADGSTLRQQCDAVINVCRLYGVPCLDLYGVSGINALTGATFLADGLHYSAADKGITPVGKPLAAWMSSVR